MKIDELYYLRATNGKDTVYYRVVVTGSTYLGKSEFRQGWFPAAAVDALFGDVSAPTADSPTVQAELRFQLDEALIKARKAYLEEVLKSNPNETLLDKRLAAIRNVRLTARDSSNTISDSLVMQYNPEKGLIVRHSGEKLVFILSSDPDEIIGRLAQLSEDSKTQAAVGQFAQVISENEHQRRLKDQQGASLERYRLGHRAQLSGDDNQRVLNYLSSFMEELGDDAADQSRDLLVGQIEGLIGLLEAINAE